MNVTVDGIKSYKVDVYSFGMTVFEIASGTKPWNDIINPYDIKDLVVNGQRPEIPKSISDFISDLIRLCWTANPSDRPEFKDICRILEEQQ